jgi:hypothetical protein
MGKAVLHESREHKAFCSVPHKRRSSGSPPHTKGAFCVTVATSGAHRPRTDAPWAKHPLKSPSSRRQDHSHNLPGISPGHWTTGILAGLRSSPATATRVVHGQYQQMRNPSARRISGAPRWGEPNRPNRTGRETKRAGPNRTGRNFARSAENSANSLS